MQRVERAAPLPTEMQGYWVGADEPTSELIVDGGKVICFGQRIAYDYKQISHEEGAIRVSLCLTDPAQEDEFQRANITGLVITREFHGFKVKFGVHFVRRLAV